MRRFVVVTTALALTIAALTGLQGVTPERADAATTTQLVTGSSITATANSVRGVTHPGAATSGVVAAASDPVSIAQASALSSITGATLIVSTSTTNASAVNAIVAQKNITQLTFVGLANAFPSSFRNAVDARVTVKKTALSNSPFSRSVSLVPSGASTFVVAKGNNVPAMEAALSYSSASGAALLVLGETEPADSLRSFLLPFADPTIILAGDPGVTDQLDSDDADRFGELLVDTPKNVDASYDTIIRSHITEKNRAANKVAIAPGDDLSSFALATLVGKAQGSVTLPAGTKAAITVDSAAHRYLQLVKGELKTLTLIGTNTTSAQLTAAAAPSLVARTPAPSWTITDTTLGTSTWTVTYTARAGASKYSALSWDNSVIASSTSTSLQLQGTPDFLTLAAFDSNNNEIDRIYYRSNAYTPTTGRATVVTGTIQNGTANLRILGAAGVPRKIIRTPHDPYAMLDAVPLPSETVAITCNLVFTDTGLNPQLQWNYEVVNLTLKTGSGCGTAAGTPISASGVPTAGLSLPLTQHPWAQTESTRRSHEDLAKPRETSDGEQLLLPRVGQTVSDVARQQIAYETAHPEAVEMAMPPAGYLAGPLQTEAATAAATGSQFVFSYQAYIPEKYILAPTYSGDINRPLTVFNGSDREWWDVNNIHTKFDIRAYVGDDEVFPTKWVGTTERYHCKFEGSERVVCDYQESRTASDSGISVTSQINGTTTVLTFTASINNPLEQFSQPIDGLMTATLTPRSWRLVGHHDRMPVHQFWWSPIYSEGTLAYMSTDPWLFCLIPNVPTCTSYVNVNM